MQAAGLRHAENLVWNEHPHLKPVYDDAIKRGRTPNEAMAESMTSADARQHGGTPGWSAEAPRPGLRGISGDPSPLGRELVMVSQWMDPAVRGQWVAALRDSGADPAAVAWAEQLLAQAGKQIATGTKQAGEPDLRATPLVDEHTAGLNGSAVDLSRGAHNAELSAAVGAGATASQKAQPVAVRAAAAAPVQLARMSFAVRAEVGLTPDNQARPGAGKTIDGQLVNRPAQQKTRENKR
ncbi:MAG: hypothetical protein HOV83_20325, partial [Catenulispora sp.]|nr:hypothetical protein [Catenulispora sp.]